MSWHGPRDNCGCCRRCFCITYGETNDLNVVNSIDRPSEQVWTIANFPSSITYHLKDGSPWFKYDINGMDAINGTYTFQGGDGPLIVPGQISGCGLLMPAGWTIMPVEMDNPSYTGGYWLSFGTVSGFVTEIGSINPPLLIDLEVYLNLFFPEGSYSLNGLTSMPHIMNVFFRDTSANRIFFGQIQSHVDISSFDRTDQNSCSVSSVRYYLETILPTIEHYGEGSTLETIM